MTNDLQKAFDSGVLDPSVHGRLLQNLDHFAQKANIQKHMITMKMSEFNCTKQEINYVKTIKRKSADGIYGLVYTGKEDGSSVITRMMAIAGACLRNFVDAKVMTIQELLSELKEGTPPEVSVLLVPNFFISRAEGGKIADWHIAELLGLLYSRMATGKQTLLYVSDFEALRKAYGDPMATHLEQHFRAIEA